jgi:hypothetical protein
MSRLVDIPEAAAALLFEYIVHLEDELAASRRRVLDLEAEARDG